MLSREQIEDWRRRLKACTDPWYTPGHYDADMDALCDLALQGLDRPAERGKWLTRLPTPKMKEAGGEAYLQCREWEGQNTGLNAEHMAKGIFCTMFDAAPPPERTADARWIPVSERLPEQGDTVLVWMPGDYPDGAIASGDIADVSDLNDDEHGFFIRGSFFEWKYATHWTLLPPAPLKEPGR